MSIKLAILTIAIVFTAGCHNEHVWDELELCESGYREKCTIVIIPVSKFDDVVEAVKRKEEVVEQ